MLSTEAVTTLVLVVILGVGDALYKDYTQHRTYKGPNNPYIKAQAKSQGGTNMEKEIESTIKSTLFTDGTARVNVDAPNGITGIDAMSMLIQSALSIAEDNGVGRVEACELIQEMTEEFNHKEED